VPNRTLYLLVSTVLLLSVTPGCARPTSGTLQITTATTTFSPGFRGDLERVVAGHHGVMGLSLKNLKTGEQLAINGDEPFPTASTIKLAVMCAVFDELSSPTSRFKSYYDTRKYDDSTSISGSGFIQRFKNGTNIEIKELLHFMITVSDNTGTNMLVEALGGLQPVNDWLINHGFKTTRMASTVGGKIIWDPKMRDTWGLGVTTPNEMRRLCEMILNGKAGTTSAEVPPVVWVGSKSGALNRSRSDNAIVASPNGMYILSIYTRENQDSSWKNSNEADTNIRKVSRLVYKHYNPNTKWTRPPGTEEL
jgi:beta-lactamase class A